MHILCTNDDGIQGPGLHLLADVAAEFGRVTIVAPDRERSAVSQAITLHSPLRIKDLGEGTYTVDGTPADCMWVAMNRLLPEPPDIIFSGVNRGPNLALDVVYSGTVAGALEGLIRDIPSVAFSLVGHPDYPFEKIRDALRTVIEKILRAPHRKDVTLNVNIPHPQNPGIRGIQVTSLGKRYYSEEVVEREDPRGGKYLWVGGSEVITDDIPGSDCNAVREGFISITPIHLNLTAHTVKEEISGLYDDTLSST